MNKNTEEKVCTFYVSDYHFEMTILPYLDKKITNQDKIVLLTQNNLEKSVKTVLENTNLKEEKKEQILKINWTNNNESKIEQIKTITKENKNIILFIKGEEKYIQNTNQKIEPILKENNKIKIIDCYNLEEIGENMVNIMETYQKTLKITGEEKIEKPYQAKAN